jgi:hypothetical protein
MLRTILCVAAAVVLAGVVVFLELIADVRTPPSHLAMRSAFVTHNKLPPEELAAATAKLKAKYGEVTKVWQGPTGIYARQDGDILEVMPAHTFFHETLGMTEVEDEAGGRALFPFHISPYELRDTVHPALVPSLMMRVATSFRNPRPFGMEDFSIEQCRTVTPKTLKMELASQILGLGTSTVCNVVWKREPSRRMLAGIVVAGNGRWIRPLAKGLCRRMGDAWLLDERRTHPDQQTDYLQCFMVDRPDNQPFGSGVSSFAYEVQKDKSLAVFVARPLGIEEAPLGPSPDVPTRTASNAATPPVSPIKSAEDGARPLTPDPAVPERARTAVNGVYPLTPNPNMPKFHRVDPNVPEPEPEPAVPASKNDAALDRLRKTLVEAANKLSDQPCDGAAKLHYLVAAVSYAKMWLALLPCLEKNYCVGSAADRRDQLEKTIGLPWQHDVMTAAEKAHQTATIRKTDFPKETLVFMANLASDPSINPQADVQLSFAFPGKADCVASAQH